MIYQKLAAIQEELFVPKNQKNSFGNYNYRSCEDILRAVKPICADLGCVLFLTNEMECIGNRNYVKATATLIELDSGEKIESVAHAREDEIKKGMDGSQVTGASSSYARKYALAGLFCIDNEKDADTNEYTKKNQSSKEEAAKNQEMINSVDPVFLPTEDGKVTKAQLDRLKAELKRTGKNLNDIESMSQAKVIAYLNQLARTPDEGK